MCLTANSTTEWLGSIVQTVRAGASVLRVALAVPVSIVLFLPRRAVGPPRQLRAAVADRPSVPRPGDFLLHASYYILVNYLFQVDYFV
jgi:hypothetical protein